MAAPASPLEKDTDTVDRQHVWDSEERDSYLVLHALCPISFFSHESILPSLQQDF